MKLSAKTIELLSNFAQINNSIWFREGSVQKTMSANKTIFVSAEFEESFPQDFGIYDTVQFINVLGLFGSPDLEFEDRYITLSEGRQKVVYRTCDEQMVTSVPKDKNITLPSVEVQFELDKVTLASVQKATRLFNLQHIAIEGDGEKIYLRSFNPKDENSNSSSIEVGETDQTFRVIINLDNMRTLPHDFDVFVSKAKLVHMKSKEAPLEYFVPCDKNSTFG